MRPLEVNDTAHGIAGGLALAARCLVQPYEKL
jgi:hypothetical protein